MNVGMIMLPLDDAYQAENLLSALQGYMLSLYPKEQQLPGAVTFIESLEKVEQRLSRIVSTHGGQT